MIYKSIDNNKGNINPVGLSLNDTTKGQNYSSPI